MHCSSLLFHSKFRILSPIGFIIVTKLFLCCLKSYYTSERSISISKNLRFNNIFIETQDEIFIPLNKFPVYSFLNKNHFEFSVRFELLYVNEYRYNKCI